jgi:hypothetical protein
MGSRHLHRSVVALILTLLSFTPLLATVGQISTAEKFEEIQFIGDLGGANPLTCLVGTLGHTVFKNTRLVTCVLLGDGVTYQYVPASWEPPAYGVYDLASTQLRARDGWFMRNVTISDPNTIPGSPTSSPVSLTVSSQFSAVDSSLQGVIAYGGGALASEADAETDFGLIRPVQSDRYNLGGLNHRFQHARFIGSVTIGSNGATCSLGSAQMSACIESGTGSFYGGTNTSEIEVKNYRMSSSGALPGAETHWFPNVTATSDLGCTSAGGTDGVCTAGIGLKQWRNATFSGTVTATTFTGTVLTDRLITTDASPSTLILSDNNTNQTLTGSLGNLILAPTGSLTTTRPVSFTGTSNAFTAGAAVAATSGNLTVGRAAGGNILFQTDNVSDIGATGGLTRPRDLFLARDIATSANRARKLWFTDGDFSGLLNVSGAVTFGSTLGVTGVLSTGEVSVGGNILPNADLTYNLGGAGSSFIDGYIDNVVGQYVSAGVYVSAGSFRPPSNGGADVGLNNLGFGAEYMKDTSAAFENKTVWTSSAVLTADRDRIMDFPDSNTTLKPRFGSGVVDFGSLTAPSCEDLTITVTGASDGDACSVGAPNASVVTGSQFTCWRSSANIVTIRHCCIRALAASCDPASGTFRAMTMSM